MRKKGCNQDSFAVSAKLGSAAAFWASKSCIWCSACSLSHAVIPIMMSSMVPVVPKNTRGPRDFRFIPTGIAKRAPATENTQVPNALETEHSSRCFTSSCPPISRDPIRALVPLSLSLSLSFRDDSDEASEPRRKIENWAKAKAESPLNNGAFVPRTRRREAYRRADRLSTESEVREHRPTRLITRFAP